MFTACTHTAAPERNGRIVGLSMHLRLAVLALLAFSQHMTLAYGPGELSLAACHGGTLTLYWDKNFAGYRNLVHGQY